MKIKKTLAIIMAATLGFATMTGCSKATNNYAKELANTSSWEATTSEVTGKVTVDSQKEKVDISFTATGYSSGDKGYSEVKFSDSQGKVKLPDIKCYVDNGTCYINKSYYEGIYTMNGQTVPAAISNIKEDYIAVDTGMNTSTLKALTTKPDSLIELSKVIFGDADIDLPYSQSGREYTLDLDSDETVDLGVKAIKAAANNIDKINTTFNLNLTADNIQQMKTYINSEQFNSGISQAKTMFAGSNISSKEVFNDDDYTADVNINIKAKDLMNMTISLNEKVAKSEAKSIEIPTSKIKLTQEQFAKLLSQDNEKTTAQSAVEQATTGMATPSYTK